MLNNRRKCVRFEVPINVKFRPTYGATDYATGVTRDLCSGGFRVEAHDFRFIVYENLELIVELQGGKKSVPVFGDVVWKRQAGRRCLAGIELKMKDRDMQKQALEQIFSFVHIPYTDGLPSKLGFIKEYYNNGYRCRVTFRLLKETAGDARNVSLIGDFNNWDPSETHMVRMDNGDFIITLDLDSNREYRFSYLIDGTRRENDWYADKYARNRFGYKISVVVV